MSEKKEQIQKEDLKKVSGGASLDNSRIRDIDNVTNPFGQNGSETNKNNDTFYGPAE